MSKDIDDCLSYFRAATTEPETVPLWAEWWAANEAKAEACFPLVDYVRLKHRGLLGAKQILEKRSDATADSSQSASAPDLTESSP